MPNKKILIVDDERLIRWSLRRNLAEWGYDAAEAETAAAGLRAVQSEPPDLVLLDVKLPDGRGLDVLEELRRSAPDLPVVMITAFGVIEDAVTAMRRGAYDYVTKPFDEAKLQAVLRHALEEAGLKRKIAAYREIDRKRSSPGPFVGAAPVMVRFLEAARRVAESETSIILLQGESGTGKDLLAQTVHEWSRRREAPFLAINCSAIPETLLESELFGYEKGAFTDAKAQKRGLVDEGTLFLDEIGGLGLALQAKLLRFLETNTFKRVGGLRDVAVDLRVIAATNQDLETLCGEGKFRKDLFYRLNVFPLRLPSLGERREDILALARHFIDQYNRKFHKVIEGLEAEAERALLTYPWPGNVRELRNAIERAMIFEDGPRISAAHLSLGPAGLPCGEPAGEDLTLAEAERRLVMRALERTGGNVTRAAELLGIGRDALRYRLSRTGEPTEG
jgi:DNA-binding NtrC family response regulator